SRSDNFCEIKRRITRPGSKIENAFAYGNARSLPTIQNYRTPDPVLQSESHQFFIMCAENVILLAHAGPSLRIPLSFHSILLPCSVNKKDPWDRNIAFLSRSQTSVWARLSFLGRARVLACYASA